MTDTEPHASATLSKSETQFRLLVDGVADYAIYMLDPNGHVVSWNSGAQRIKGYAPHDIIGSHYRRFYTPADQAAGEPERNLARAASEGRVEAEGWRVRKDGTRFWAHVIIDRIRDDQGRLVGFAKVTRDVTEQRAAERDLEEARMALFQSQKMEAIGQLTGGMAHDFNNLLMAIQSALDLLGPRLPTDERTRNIYGTALAGVERGASLTQRMLAFARRQELEPRAVSVVDLVRGMSRLLERTVGDRFEIATRFAPRLCDALVDPHQLELALLNLVVNARDAYAEHGGRIVIEADVMEPPHVDAPELGPGRYVRLSVIDSGQGMDVDTLARSTDPFFTTKGVGKGTGLGLSMVHGLAAQSHGRLSLQSKPGTGTRADLWLPAAEHVERIVESALPEPAKRHGASRLRVLTVDDDALVLTTLEALLEDLGHEVTAVSSAREALTLLEAGASYDVLMTDYAMPGKSGVELAKDAKKLRPDLPIVLATGYAEISLKDFPDLHRLGKPFDRSRLSEVLEQATAAG
ncbi:PAS domain S-box protein [Luteibacter aegosomatis]|uniref:PAS domain-containing sensor histidine kinase n=1 Tax=Luteibacter aegosomatis TaxID=2911537 RepID=UPI001FFB6F92|nr:PAS domain-containing sensor histidine kinase [Luteibacter aegosomatis]UPG87417.1 PAS domain S-box protein [Luteibacter aegosomatis]